jgi:hypothetical protein
MKTGLYLLNSSGMSMTVPDVLFMVTIVDFALGKMRCTRVSGSLV